MGEGSARREMQPAADGDRSKLDPRGKVGTEDIRAWMIVGYKLFMQMVEAKMFSNLGVGILPLEDDEDAIGAIDEIDQGTSMGPIPGVILIDISAPTISAVDIGQRVRQSQKLKSVVIILISANPIKIDEANHIGKSAQADTVLCQPLPDPVEFKRIVAQIRLSKP